MKVRILTCILLALYYYPLSSQLHSFNRDDTTFSRIYTPAELQFDLAIFKEGLLKVHPGLFWHMTPDDFERKVQDIKDSLSVGRTELQFYKLLIPLCAKIACGHTYMLPSKDHLKLFHEHLISFPFEVKLIQGRLFVGRNWSSDSLISRGTEILSINGVSSAEIIKTFSNNFWVDGSYNTARELGVEHAFSWYLYCFYGPHEKFSILLSDQIKGSFYAEVPKISEAQKNLRNTLRYPDTRPPEYYGYMEIKEQSIGILTINSFETEGLTKFLKSTFEKLHEHPVDNLVIDLRENQGGNDVYGKQLYSWIALEKFKCYDHIEMVVNPSDTILKYGRGAPSGLWVSIMKRKNGKRYWRTFQHVSLTNSYFAPNRKAFNGKVYILMGHKSFSLSSDFCSMAHYYKRATIIGQESAGGCHGNSSGLWFNLPGPNTGLQFNISCARYLNAVSGCEDGRGVLPDVWVERTPTQIIEARDAEMEMVMKIINNR